LFHAIEDRADQVREADRCRHVGVELLTDAPEIVEMMVGEGERFQFVGHARGSFFTGPNEMHMENSVLGVTGTIKSLP